MTNKVKKDWITESGLRAVILDIKRESRSLGEESWYCGYVAVKKGSPLFGVNYSDRLPSLKGLFEELKKEECSPEKAINDYGALGVFAMALDDSDCPQLGYLLKVHGGVTYSATSKEYPAKCDFDVHWIGYDCNHASDYKSQCDLEFNEAQCESLASQICILEKAILENKDD